MESYLSATVPRWNPRTEQDLQAACVGGLFDESHLLEAKRLVHPGKEANRELARDLASFAIDGGTVVIGIDEDKKTGTFSLAPQPLADLVERIESVAYTVPDPPLSVVIDTISTAAGDGTGYLLVHVPPSPMAPHMVDGRYLGRGEKQKRYLQDGEVARLHALRRRVDLDTMDLLREEIARDPVPEQSRHRAHLFLVAQPLTAPADLLTPLIDGAAWVQKLNGLVGQAIKAAEDDGKYVASLGAAQQSSQRRSAGVALSSYTLGSGRTVDDTHTDPEPLVDVEFRHNGGIRIFMGRLGDNHNNQDVIFEGLAVLYVREVVELARLVGEETGYLGAWALGFAANRLKGAPSWAAVENMQARFSPRYDRDEEHVVTTATYPELRDHPGPVTDRLVGNFLRAYNLRPKYLHLLTDPRIDATYP